MLILRGPDKPVNALVFAPDAATLFAVHGYVGVHVWNLADRTMRRFKIKGLQVFGEFAIQPGGKWALGRCPDESDDFDSDDSDQDSVAIDLTTRRARPVNFMGTVGQHIAFSPDGSQLVTVGHSAGDKKRPAKIPSDRLYGWKMTAAGPRYEWHLDTPADAEPWRIVFAGNDTLVSEDWIPKGRPGTVDYYHKQPRLAVRSATSGKPLRIVKPPTDYIEQLLASPDGKQVVVRRGTALWVYDSTDWKRPPRKIAGKTGHLLEESMAAFHPSGQYLLLANNGPSVIVFDTSTWKQVRKWNWKAGTLRAVAVSQDGTLAAAGGPRGTVVVWDLDL